MTQKLSQVRPITKEEQDRMMAQFLAQQQAVQAAAAGPGPGAGLRHRRARQSLSVQERPRRLLAGFDEADPATWGNPGRNDACPCGSGQKFKHCHGKLA